MTETATGTVVRVVGVVSQEWGQEWGSQAAERTLIGLYVGKVGTVVDVDRRDMPYRVQFSDKDLPLDEMRFFREEVEEIG